MVISSIIALLVGQGGGAPATIPIPTLTYKAGIFTIKNGAITRNVRIQSATIAPVKSVLLKSGANQATWTSQGLSLKFGKAIAKDLKLGDALTSPKLFSSEKIGQTIARIKSGDVSRKVAGLSGWHEQNGTAIFLVRFDDKAKKPWIECLFSVDLKAKAPNFSAIATFDSLTGSTKAISQNLIQLSTGYAIIGRLSGEWGVDFIPMGGLSSSFTPVGTNMPTYQILENGKTVSFVEKTAYGTHLAGLISIPDGKPTFLAESKDVITFPGLFSNIVQVSRKDDNIIRNTNTGLELVLPKNIGVENTRSGVLVWTPKIEPRTAILYDPNALRSLVRWNAPKSVRTPAP